MHLVGTLHVFKFSDHLQLELRIHRNLSALETLGPLHGQRVEIDLVPCLETEGQPHTGVPTRQERGGEHLA